MNITHLSKVKHSTSVIKKPQQNVITLVVLRS